MLWVEIRCKACGGMRFAVPGHHMPVIAKALAKVMATYPELCKEQVTEVPEGTTYVPNPGKEPS